MYKEKLLSYTDNFLRAYSCIVYVTLLLPTVVEVELNYSLNAFTEDV